MKDVDTTEMNPESILRELGIDAMVDGLMIGPEARRTRGEKLMVTSPIDGRQLHRLTLATSMDVVRAVSAAEEAFQQWRLVPAPVRGELVRRFGNRLREEKHRLGALVSWEVGKIASEAEGEIQEMIDICDFATGLSRQLYGLTMASERPGHRLAEQWHPLGPVGIISAFNFPGAVWAWNAALALVCGDPVIWKPSEKAPLCALACQHLLNSVIADFPQAPSKLSSVVIGGREVGAALAESRGISLLSATGSVAMGKSVAIKVAARLGRSLLELGGNNAMILTPSAPLDLALRAIVFSAVGTAGQRCTSLRRLIVHHSIYHQVTERLRSIYSSLPIGHPLMPGILVGPLIDQFAAQAYDRAIEAAQREGGRIFNAGRANNVPPGGYYVKPALVEIEPDASVVQQETFGPILYIIKYKDLDEAIAIQNGVPQGLSSAIFTSEVREAETFCGPAGSDCGIANVNIGTSGAEIGGAFGGDKETGGGRESGSDAWKNYMRRVTNTINYSAEMPLAQGIRFDLS